MAKQELNFKDNLESLSTFIKQFTGTEKGSLRPFIEQYKPVFEDGKIVTKEDGTQKRVPMTFVSKDKDGNEVKQYITQISFFKKDEKDPNKAQKVVVNVFSKYLVEPDKISIIKDTLVKEGLDRFKEAPIKKLSVEEYTSKDGKVTRTLTFSTNYGQYGLEKKSKETKAKVKETPSVEL